MYGETSARLFELFFGPISMAVPLIESSCKADSANVIYSMHPMGRWGGIVGNSREWVWCLHGLPLWVYWYSLLQLICGDHCLAFSNQSTGLGEIRQAKKDDGRVYTAHSTRQSENFSTILGWLRLWYLGKGWEHRKVTKRLAHTHSYLYFLVWDHAVSLATKQSFQDWKA